MSSFNREVAAVSDEGMLLGAVIFTYVMYGCDLECGIHIMYCHFDQSLPIGNDC